MTVTLSPYTICIGILLANLVMIAFLLVVIREGRNRVANRFLALFCIVLAVGFSSDILSDNQAFEQHPWLMGLDVLMILSVGPLFYGYVREMTQLRLHSYPAYGWHLLPIAVFGCWMVSFKQQPTGVQIVRFHAYMTQSESAPFLVRYYPKLVMLAYLVAAYQVITRHQRTVREVLADVGQRDLSWVKSLLLGVVGLYAWWVLNNEALLPDVFFALLPLGFSYWLGYHVITQKAIYAHINPPLSLDVLTQAPKRRYQNSSLTETAKQAWTERLTVYMTTQKPYLDADLTLTSLADQVHLLPTQLSQVLNECLGENFYGFINRHRVEESKRLLENPAYAHYSILGIAYEAGFKSKSTFNKSFRESVGQSPSDYQKKQVDKR